MHAVYVRRFGGPETLTVESVPDPEPTADQVMVDIRATGANFVDLLVTGGTYQFVPKLPFVPGKLPAGIVSAIGANVRGLAVGDRVLTLAEQGGYATKVAVAPAACLPLPDSMTFVDAAAMGLAYDTAWFALCDRARGKAGEVALVLGASGGVGLAAIQIAKVYGLRVLAGISNPDKADLVRAAGADEIVDLAANNLHESLRQQVHRLTGGHGADIVLDPLGGDFFDAAVRAVAWCGRLVIIGFASGRIPTLKMNYVLLKNIEVSGLQVSDYRKRRPEQMRQCYTELFRHYESGALRPPPTTVFPLEKTGEALRLLRDRAVMGRIVVTPQSET
ncbi:NADPH:quinone oxidoreductase family protein [Rhodoplanes roseus]|uniref:NADPH:quinone oxidoreductase n=1 Tax=Rhodoplanes roseus TaxID=29409 RepID=A0A327L2D1_9BRAD|nr:NADPH:quinone oxidoreductase family protein [Rhodoplanes roseus]RAI44145.1 NADPH:quinone oxidoreductase [Rhodoplanes roseus]